MKRILTGLLALVSGVCIAATTVPVQLISPSGSTSGQAILSTGASTAPAWGPVSLSGITGTLAVTNGGTGATTATNARTNLGLGTAATQNTGTSGATLPLLNGANTWSAAQTFSVRPTFNSATPWDSANLAFATPPAIGGTTPAAGAFTTLSATGAITPSQTAGIVGTTTNNNANAGSVGEYTSASSSSTSIANNTATNITSVSLTAGDWDVSGVILFAPQTGATATAFFGSISTTSATLGPLGQTYQITPVSITAGNGLITPAPVTRVSIAATTTVYLVGYSTFSGGTVNTTGFIRARRVR